MASGVIVRTTQETCGARRIGSWRCASGSDSTRNGGFLRRRSEASIGCPAFPTQKRPTSGECCVNHGRGDRDASLTSTLHDADE